MRTETEIKEDIKDFKRVEKEYRDKAYNQTQGIERELNVEMAGVCFQKWTALEQYALGIKENELIKELM